MAFNSFDEDMNIISKLGDEPNEDDGLSAAALKARFDLAGNKIKAFLNNLIATMAGVTGAANIGFQSSEAISGNTVQAAIENVQEQISGVSQGSVANGSISTAKIQDDAVTNAKMAADTLRSDLDAADVLQLRRSDFSSVTNNLKFHYFRALGMVFIEGSVTVVPTQTGYQSVTYDFADLVPINPTLARDDSIYLDTYDRHYYTAAIVDLTFREAPPTLVITTKNLSDGSVNDSLTISISGWYICEPESQEA